MCDKCVELEQSWQKTLRIERECRLNEVRLKERYRYERDQLAKELEELKRGNQ